MPTSSAIKWREVDEKRLQNLVKRYNDKIRRVSVRHPDIADIQPSRVSYKELRNDLMNSSRREYNRVMKMLARYLKRGAEKEYINKQGVRMTKYQRRELSIGIQTINARRRAERKKANVSTYTGTMGILDTQNLYDRKNYTDYISQRGWENYVKSVEKQLNERYIKESSQRYKENYLSGLAEQFGENSRVYDIASKMNAEDLLNFAYNDPLGTISFIYSPYESEQRQELIIGRMENYMQ